MYKTRSKFLSQTSSMSLLPAGDALGAIETQLRAGEKVAPGWLNNLQKLKTNCIIALTEHMEKPPTPLSTAQIDIK
jgi:hypothetical protein